MLSKHINLKNVHPLYFDSKLWPTSSRRATIQVVNKELNSLHSLTIANYDRFISIANRNKGSDFSLTISPSEWATLSQHLLYSESDEMFESLSSPDKKCFANILRLDFHNTNTIPRRLFSEPERCHRGHYMSNLLRNA